MAWICLAAAGLTLLIGSGASRAPVKEDSASATTGGDEARVPLQARGRGNPWLNLRDGETVPTRYSGPEEVVRGLEARAMRPLSLVSADFDEDGMPDLVCGYERAGRGVLTLHRGNVDAVYPHTAGARGRRATGDHTEAPFLPEARALDVDAPPDFLGAGDFDADGHWDIVLARTGDSLLRWLPGDGGGGFGPPVTTDVGGAIRSLVTGDVNRRDGLEDVILGLVGGGGAELLVFEGPEGARLADPESIAMPAAPLSLAVGQVDGEYPIDMVAAAGRDLLIIRGRDRRLSLDAERRAQVKPAAVHRTTLPAAVTAVALGDFRGEGRTDIAVLSSAGRVLVALPADLLEAPAGAVDETAGPWREAGVLRGDARLIAARISGLRGHDLLTVDRSGRALRVLMPDGQAVGLEAQDEPIDVLPMRLNADALGDLVVLTSGTAAPMVVPTEPLDILTVTNTGDSGTGSLRQAILTSNSTPGADTIVFDIPGTGVQTISPATALPRITGPVKVDGTTQPGSSPDAPLIELDGSLLITGNNWGLYFDGGASVLRGLVLNRFGNPGGSGGSSAALFSGTGGNIVEGNFIGTDPTGTVALANRSGLFFSTPDNRLGGTVVAARNVISGSQFQGAEFYSTGAVGNVIQGNYIGTDRTGTADLGNNIGLFILAGATNNTVGGSVAGAANVVSGNVGGIHVQDVGTMGNLVQRNFVGTDATGNVALANELDGVSMQTASSGAIGGTASSLRNVISGNWIGIRLTFASDFLIQGNFIGTDMSGTGPIGNTRGILVDRSEGNTVGGSVSGARNVISGNQSIGLDLALPGSGTTGNAIQGNFVGLDVNGTGPLGNEIGIAIQLGASFNLIGGATPAERNVISGNRRSGVRIEDPGTQSNRVIGNYIGMDVTGLSAVANGEDGVAIDATDGNEIGGGAAGEGNVISGNLLDGVRISSGAGLTGNSVYGNLIGLDANGAAPRRNGGNGIEIIEAPANRIGGDAPGRRNVISSNVLVGIRISGASSSNNQIDGNYIGTDITGSIDRGNLVGGIEIEGAPDNLIGNATGAGNLISGNHGVGVRVEAATGNRIVRNRIGTMASGTARLGNGGTAIFIKGASGNFVGDGSLGAGNIISGNNEEGLRIQGVLATNNVVLGNLIGVDSSGGPLGNSFDGVRIVNDASGNTIGGPSFLRRNVISGNGRSGVSVETGASGNVFHGNYIGLDPSGATVVPNGGDGVFIWNGSDNIVGGAGAGEGNVISGNALAGVEITSTGAATGNRVQGNLIGTAADGLTPAGNVYDGIRLTGPSATDNFIGGAFNPGLGNLIAFNGLAGVTTLAGSGNLIRQNRIHSNGGLGIDLGIDGVTPNDPDDSDAGPNGLQNFPVILSASSCPNAGTTIQGTLTSTPGTGFTLEFYASSVCDPSGFGEGARFIGAVDIATDAGGHAAFLLNTPVSVSGGEGITGIAASPEGNTSEFSACVPAFGSRPGDVAGLVFSPGSATVMEWLAAAGADSYNVYWGLEIDLLKLLSVEPDSCLRATVAGTASGPILTETPLAGSMHWFLVRAQNGCGQGPAGNAFIEGLDIGRLQESTGTCAAATSCAHGKCDLGAALSPGCDPCATRICEVDPFCCAVEWDALCVQEVASVCGSLACPASAGACAHTLCTTGAPLVGGCDSPPAALSCVDTICAADPFCCDPVQSWDLQCISETDLYCGKNCN